MNLKLRKKEWKISLESLTCPVDLWDKKEPVIIGVAHVPENLEKVINYVTSDCFKAPEKVMLELPPDWEDIEKIQQESGFTSRNPYFEKIACAFDWNETKIILGDVKRRYTFDDGIAFIERTICLNNKIYNTNSCIQQSAMQLMKKYHFFKANTAIYINMRNPFFRAARDEGFAEVFEREKPDLTIVGAAHARALKCYFPNVKVKYEFSEYPYTNAPYIPFWQDHEQRECMRRAVEWIDRDIQLSKTG